MELKQLRYFTAICEEASFSGAAMRLRIAQPALSQQIKNLEAELRVQLLIRESRGVRPTAAGARFLEYARRIVGEMAFAVEAARGADAEPEGAVRLGMPGPVCEMIGAPLVEALAARFPGISLHITEAMSGYILEWLHNGRVDLALLYVTPETSDLPGERIFREELHLITPADQPPARTSDGAVRFADLGDMDLILPASTHGLRHVLDSFARKAGFSLNPVIETDSYGLMKQLVARQRGVSILPPGSIRQEKQAGRLQNHPVMQPALTRDIAIAFATPKPPPLAVTTVATVCREAIATLVANGEWLGQPLGEVATG